MRLLAVMPREDQVGGLVDSLRNAGFDRKDMIISDMVKTGEQAQPGEVAFIETERDGLWETAAYPDVIAEEYDGSGILVAVDVPKKKASIVRELMEQAGAIRVVQD